MALVHGIDLGAWRVRVATLDGNFRRVNVRDVVEMEAADGQDSALAAIQAQDRGWENADHVAALPLEHAAARIIKLPFTDRNTILKALPAEVESSVPYDLEDMVLATHFIDTTSTPSRTLAITATRDRVRARLDRLKAAKADPKLLPLDAHALSTYAESGVQVVIDVGHTRTLVVLAQNGEMLGARLVPSGGAALTAVVQAGFACTTHDAESYKHQVSLTAAADHLADEVTDSGQVDGTRNTLRNLITAVDEWINDVRANLIALEDEHGVGVDEVMVAGGGSLLEGLNARLEAQLGVPVRPVAVPGGHGPAAALVVALGKVAAGEPRPVDLRVAEFAYKGHADVLWNIVFYGVAAAAAAVLAGVVMFGLSVHDLNTRMDDVDAKIAAAVTSNFPDVTPDRLAEPSMALAIMQEKTSAAIARVEALGATVGGVPPTLETFKTLSQAVPPGREARIDVRELNITEESITLKADTDTYESAAKIEDAVKKNPRYSQARKSDEKKVGDGLSFTMTIPLGEAPAEAAAPAGEEG